MRQGCGISPYLMLCCAELISIEIRKKPKIKGIKIKDWEIKLIQFADDMNLSLIFEEESFTELVDAFDAFEGATGFKVNYNKTSVYRIGSLRNSNAKLYMAQSWHWTNKPIRILGTMVDCNEDKANERNLKKILPKVRETCNRWFNRNQSLIGKVLIVNTLLSSLFVYKLSIVPALNEEQIKEAEKIINEYLLQGKCPKFVLSRLQNAKELGRGGGLKLLSIKDKDAALKAQWVADINISIKLKQWQMFFYLRLERSSGSVT